MLSGLEKNDDETLITVFSAPGYGKKFDNPACLLKITKNFFLVPNFITESKKGESSPWGYMNENMKNS